MSWLKHTYASQLPQSLFTEQPPEHVENPHVRLYNQPLAEELGISSHFSAEQTRADYLSGNSLLPHSKPIAQAYAGHQFGGFNRLGDGRAVLLGEIASPAGLYDLQLKGSGQTAYSRRGDGRATYYSMLREYLISEAMHALNIPTTRSLAVIESEDKIYREEIHNGGILSRIAASHIRVGTFEYARFFGRDGDLAALLNYTIKRHYPELLDHPDHALALLEKVMLLQKDLIVNWMRVGFIHGVMNTDNMAISGETIDYGPCAFMNTYHPKTVFSSIDTEGRYAFGNQPNIAYWNLGVFANALIPLIDEDEEVAMKKIDKVLDPFPNEFSKSYFRMMYNKLGIVTPTKEDQSIVQGCLGLLAKLKVDYTNFFTGLRRGDNLIQELRADEGFNKWYKDWDQARSRDGDLVKSERLMQKTNPVIIPRNHLVEEVLVSAVSGDMNPFDRLLNDLLTPYDDKTSLQGVPANFDQSYQTFCGT